MTDTERLTPINQAQKHPVVRTVPIGDFLTDRQRVWLKTRTFDFQTENPSVYKSLVDARQKTGDVLKECRDLTLEVQSLQDDPKGPESPHTLVRKLAGKRREKHNQGWCNMKEELTAVSLECEKMLVLQADSTRKALADVDNCVSRLLDESSFKSGFHHMVHDDLVELWEDTVCRQLSERRDIVTRTAQELDDVEDHRVSLVNEVLGKWSQVFLSIGHLLPEGIARLMDSEALTVNKAVIGNKSRNADVVLGLWSAHMMKKKALHKQWEELVLSWKLTYKHRLSKEFMVFMESYWDKWTADVDSIKSCWRAQLESANKKRLQCVTDLKSVLPPGGSKAACHTWYKTLLSLSGSLVKTSSSYMEKLQCTQETVTSTCLHEVERSKDILVHDLVCTEEEACQFALDHLIPHVEQLQEDHRQELTAYDGAMSAVMEHQSGKLQDLYQSCLGAVHLWEICQSSLLKTEQDMNDSLKKCRYVHDRDNQMLENNLDLVLDQLRQGSSEEVLHKLLGEALSKLSHLTTTYATFHQLLLATVQEYPTAVQSAVDSYSIGICKYFKVDRNPIKKTKKSSKTRGQKSRISRTSTQAAASQNTWDVSEALEEVIKTASGFMFYITKEGLVGKSGSSVFLTEDVAADGPQRNFVAESISIGECVLEEVYKRVQLEFLDHLEHWRQHTATKTEEVVAMKSEEFATELDLRLHLHSPRANRIECDIHHVRAAELLSHKERVSGHTAGVRSKLSEMKVVPNNFMASYDEMHTSFVNEMSTFEDKLSKVNRSSELDAMERQIGERYKQYSANLMLCCVDYERKVKGSADALTTSTQHFRQSLKLFSEGGNYSRDEVEVFSQKMDRLSRRVDAVSDQALKEIATRYQQCQETGEKLIEQFNQKLSLYRAEIEFVEKLNCYLSSCQIKIKAEVARSNTWSESLHRAITSISTELSFSDYQVERVCALLRDVFEEARSRVNYLHCSSHHQGALVGIEVDSPVIPLSSVTATQAILELASGKVNISDKGQRSPAKASSDSRKGTSSQSKNRQMERTHVCYGTGGGKEGSGCFLPLVRGFLKDCHVEIYATAEGFYRLRGIQGVVRSDLVEGTFDLCLDRVIARLQSYRKQAELYRNTCVDELRTQLQELTSVLSTLPQKVLSRLSQACIASYSIQKKSANEQHRSRMDVCRQEHVLCVSQLRPGLGHPSQMAVLSGLESQRSQVYQAARAQVVSHSAGLREAAQVQTREFAQLVVDGTLSLMAALDDVVLPEDLAQPCGGWTSKKKESLQEMLRDHVTPSQPVKASGVASNRKWPPIQQPELSCGDKAVAKKLQSSVVSSRCSSLHEEVVSARDAVCRDHQQWFIGETHLIDHEERTHLDKEKLVYDSWKSSVDAVRQLYATDNS